MLPVAPPVDHISAMNERPSPLDSPEPPAVLPPMPELARVVEQRLHESIGTFAMSGARLYGVTVDGHRVDPVDDELAVRFRLCFLAEHGDVYELLEAPSSALGKMFDAAAVVTTGWAAPLGRDGEPEGPPSEHALRRRVRLVVVVADSGAASVLRFEDAQADDEVVVDAGSASGALANAIDAFWHQSPSRHRR